ncbi:hypothetical protein Tco_0020376 [Tanacetum coccineum]
MYGLPSCLCLCLCQKESEKKKKEFDVEFVYLSPSVVESWLSNAFACRKAHLLVDKQILSVGVFDEVSFYIHFQAFGKLWRNTHYWNNVRKKRDKIAVLHEVTFKECVHCLEMAFGFVAMPSDSTSDSVMTGRKAHLLKDKQIPSVWVFDEMAFGGNTRELGSFREKRTRLQLYTKVEEEKGTQTLETASQLLMTASDYQRDDIRKFEIALGLNRHSEALEDSAKQWH